MTIKQHGGVFGRNPKFNNVEAESLSIAGNAVPDASTILVDSDIGSTVQGYDADTAKYDDATANFTGTLQNGGSNVLVDTDIGSTVQGYDADTAKLDVAQTFTAAQTFDENIVMANGKGIDFSATAGTGTSELFDDYEEGTFTVSAARITDLSTNVGRYTKVGNLVTCEINLSWTSSDGTGNDVIFTGLPFTTATGTETSVGPTIVYGTDINTDVGVALALRIDDSQTRFFLVRAMHSSFDTLNGADMNSATTLRSTFTYTAA